MKKLLVLLLAASFLTAPFNLYADESDGETPPPPPPPVQIPIGPITPPPSSPDPGEINPCALSPIDGLCVNGNVELFFYQDLGLVAVTVVNNATGDMWYCAGESRDGVASLPIDTQRGSYVVTIETEYAGKFVGYFAL